MYIERVPNRSSPPAVLLRESYREHGKVKKRTLANLSKWPAHLVDGLRVLLKGGFAVASFHDAFDIVRSLPHGHVAAVLGTLKHLELHTLIARKASRRRELLLAMIVARVIDAQSKLATARALSPPSAVSTLGEALQLGEVDENELYAAMDWLVGRQVAIEERLAARHLSEHTLVLYDLTSTYFEGSHCELAQLGHSRDGKSGTPQIVFGLLCTEEGCPVAVEVFSGSTADPKTVEAQVDKIRNRFGLKQVVLVGDRGMLTAARIREDLQGVQGLRWITTLRSPTIRKLVGAGEVAPSLFDERDLAEITCESFSFRRDQEKIAAEAALDGLYIVRSNVEPEVFDADQTVRAYKGLSKVERAFRCMKSVDLKVRPIHHRRSDRVRAHVLLCMLAYYVEWHMRRSLAPLLFDDHDRAGAERRRASEVAPVQRSEAAAAKASSKRTEDGLPVHSFRTLINELGTLTANTKRVAEGGNMLTLYTRPTPVQQRCFELLGITPSM